MHIGKIHFYNDSRQTLQIKCYCSKTSFSISQRVLEGSELLLSLIHFSRDQFAAVPNSAGYGKKRTCLLTFDLHTHKKNKSQALASHSIYVNL